MYVHTHVIADLDHQISFRLNQWISITELGDSSFKVGVIQYQSYRW